MAHPVEKVTINYALPLETAVRPVILGFNDKLQRPIMHPHRPANFQQNWAMRGRVTDNLTSFTSLFFRGGDFY